MPQESEYSEKWYYDACTLDCSTDVYGEMISKHHPKQIFLSHLAIGEAYGNIYEQGEERIEQFNELLERLRDYLRDSQMKIIGNEKIKDEFEQVVATFPEMDIVDAVHVATAMLMGTP